MYTPPKFPWKFHVLFFTSLAYQTLIENFNDEKAVAIKLLNHNCQAQPQSQLQMGCSWFYSQLHRPASRPTLRNSTFQA